MPKLNTTLDNIETVANKVIGTTPSADWTDAQYQDEYQKLYDEYYKKATDAQLESYIEDSHRGFFV